MLSMKAWTEVRTWESDLGSFDVTGVDDERRHRHRVDLVLRVVLPESGVIGSNVAINLSVILH